MAAVWVCCEMCWGERGAGVRHSALTWRPRVPGAKPWKGLGSSKPTSPSLHQHALLVLPAPGPPGGGRRPWRRSGPPAAPACPWGRGRGPAHAQGGDVAWTALAPQGWVRRVGTGRRTGTLSSCALDGLGQGPRVQGSLRRPRGRGLSPVHASTPAASRRTPPRAARRLPDLLLSKKSNQKNPEFDNAVRQRIDELAGMQSEVRGLWVGSHEVLLSRHRFRWPRMNSPPFLLPPAGGAAEQVLSGLPADCCHTGRGPAACTAQNAPPLPPTAPCLPAPSLPACLLPCLPR